MEKENKKIKSYIKLLEQYSGKKVKLIETKKLDEVKRTPLKQPLAVRSYLQELFRKYKLNTSARIVVNGSTILVEDKTPEVDIFNYRNVAFELIENGFKKIRNKNINGKSFSQLIDPRTEIKVFLPQYS